MGWSLNFILAQWNHRKNHAELYSTQNEGKSVFAERFVRTLKNKIYKCDFNIKKCVYW